MCLARGRVGGVGGEWVRGLGLGFTNPGGTRRKWDMCLCFGCGSVGWVAWVRVWEGGVVLMAGRGICICLWQISKIQTCLHIARFYEEHCQPSSRSAWLACTKNGNRAAIAGGGRDRHKLHRVCHTTVTDPPHAGCVFWSQNCQSSSHILFHSAMVTHGTSDLYCLIVILNVPEGASSSLLMSKM